jgi:hypothetical protein
MDSNDEAAYVARHFGYLNDLTINTRTLKFSGQIVGSIGKFVMENEAQITYWIDKKFWGRGIATKALQSFLKIERTACDNIGSIELSSLSREATAFAFERLRCFCLRAPQATREQKHWPPGRSKQL